MVKQLSLDQIIQLIKETPESEGFDWKADFPVPNGPEKQGEFIKDLTAMANSPAAALFDSFIVYGVDPRRPDPIVGITATYDDANLQQLVAGKIDPPVRFVYYEIRLGLKTIAIVQIEPSKARPHIVRCDLGKVRRGMIPIRRGSSTDGVCLADLFEMFYGVNSGYFEQIIRKRDLDIQEMRAENERLHHLQNAKNDTIRAMEINLGLQPGELGSR